MNKKELNGRSPLSFATGYGYLDIVQILSNTDGIKIDSKDNGGQTPLSHAAEYLHIMEVLQHWHK